MPTIPATPTGRFTRDIAVSDDTEKQILSKVPKGPLQKWINETQGLLIIFSGKIELKNGDNIFEVDGYQVFINNLQKFGLIYEESGKVSPPHLRQFVLWTPQQSEH